MRSESFNVSGRLQQRQLRENSDSLQIDGKGPHYLRYVKGTMSRAPYFEESEVLVDNQSQQETRREQPVEREVVFLLVVGGSVLCVNVIDGSGGSSNENNLHRGKVSVEPRDVINVPWQVQVTTHEDNEVQHLSLE